MPLVVLIGDSIRMGYQETVRKELESVAEVWAPDENGGDSRNVLGHLDEWVITRKPDIVHLNCGLHDLKRDKQSGEYQVPLEVYREDLDAILGLVATETSAKVIFATTTPVNEEWHHERKEFDRFERDVDEYNGTALELAEEHGVIVDDLFKVMQEVGKDEYLSPDGVHFNADGYELLGKAAAEAIRKLL